MQAARIQFVVKILLLVGILGQHGIVAQRGGRGGRTVPNIAERPLESSSPIEHSSSGRELPGKERSPGVYIREEPSAASSRLYGKEYSNTLRATGEARFAKLEDSAIDLSKIRVLSLVDNSHTTESIRHNSVLSRRTTEIPQPTRAQILAAVNQSKKQVVLLLTHITKNGSIEAVDGNVVVSDLVAVAKKCDAALLVVGCYSAQFVGSGYTTALNSVEMANRIGVALASARTFGELLRGLATPQEPLLVDWQFLATAHDILQIKITSDGGKEERGMVYAINFPGTQGAPPSLPVLPSLAVHTALPYWLLRGVWWATMAMGCTVALRHAAPGVVLYMARKSLKLAGWVFLFLFSVQATVVGGMLGFLSICVVWVLVAALAVKLESHGMPSERQINALGAAATVAMSLFASRILD